MRYAPDVRKDPYYVSCEPSTLSEVAIPLRVGERLVGVFTARILKWTDSPRQQLRMLQACATTLRSRFTMRGDLQMERAEHAALDREAEEARAIQQALLPKSSPYIPGLHDFRAQRARARRGRRLVRLHSFRRRALGNCSG